jgi:UDP-glucuronate 4-epimerase
LKLCAQVATTPGVVAIEGFTKKLGSLSDPIAASALSVQHRSSYGRVMAVLVTGAAGFIGAATARAILERGTAEVVGIDNLSDYYDPSLKQARLDLLERDFPDRFRFERIDFADAGKLKSISDGFELHAIVHLGAQAGVRYSLENPEAYVQANLVGHCNLLELARQRRPDHFVYASSSSVYGGNKRLPFRVEDRVDHPLSLYAATKKADELLSECYANLYRLPQTGLRFFTVYGPWGRPDMAMWIFTKSLYAGEPLPLYNGGEMRRDFTYIDDIVRGIIACLDSPPADDGSVKAGGSLAPHAIYNIGNSRSEDLMRVVELLEREIGKKALIDPQPMQPGDVKETFADISAIERDHGFRPTTTIDEGVPQFVRWFSDYHGC